MAREGEGSMTNVRDGGNTGANGNGNGNGKTRDRDDRDRLLTQKEAAILFEVKESTISTWIRRKKLRAVRMPSGRNRVRASEVAKWLGEAAR
jgi:excisionase family DNA binding protein